ncbi:MAG TPA: T9SS type A sorting domain-containing protein [bacterium]
MNRSLPLFACLGLLAILPLCAHADIIYVQGDVSGVWDVDSVIVTGEVRVPPGETLQIMPGVEILFQVYCKFIVDNNATLLAVGTEQDSIRFDELASGIRWRGIRFIEASDSCQLQFCIFSHGFASAPFPDDNGGAIYCDATNAIIDNCIIKDNAATSTGGGIFCRWSSAIISNSYIADNSAAAGGGIYCTAYSSTLIIGNFIEGNSVSEQGGGILCGYSSDAEILNNVIRRNRAEQYGGGVSCLWALPAIHQNIICQNLARISGGGIDSFSSNPSIVKNIIFGNCAMLNGGGIQCYYYANANIIENTIVENAANWGGGVFCSYSSPTMNGCVLWNNHPEEIVVASLANPQITYSNIEDSLWPGTGNISEDPLFVNPEQHDYRLPWGSPCIDSGDPNPIYNDPDSSRSDMGAFNYDQSVPVRVLLTPYNAPIQIPPAGGSFDYMITASNCTGSPLTVDFWCDATLPSDSLIGPLLGPVAAMIPANDNVSVLRTQRVPAASGIGPPKMISYNGYAAVGPDTSRDSFTFWRMGDGSGSLAAAGWDNWGDWFEIVGRMQQAAPLHPTEFALHSPFPNPFNAVTIISFDLPMASRVRLEIFDISGRSIPSGSGTTPTTKLIDGWREAGSHEVTFDASNLASGVHIYRLQAGDFVASQKLILLK